MFQGHPTNPWDYNPIIYEGEITQMDNYMSSYSHPSQAGERVITDVWEDNLEEEFERMKVIAQKYTVISLDTEFPGTVVRPQRTDSAFLHENLATYFSSALSVNSSEIIQLGLCFYDENGCNAPGGSTWQFNFKYDNKKHLHNKDSIDLLTKSNIKFERHINEGIDHARFTEIFIKSGLIMNIKYTWVTFHGGIDLAYLLKMCLGHNIPYKYNSFMAFLRMYFPYVYDIRYIIHAVEDKKGSLGATASSLDIARSGTQHQAGSDSMLTGDVYFKFRQKVMRNSSIYPYCGFLCPYSISGFGDINSASYASYFPPTSFLTLEKINS